MNAKLELNQLTELLDPGDEAVTTLANASAFLGELLEDINWVGFYLLKGETLYLGPFQGKPACTRIAVGKGVCGTAIQQDRTLRVDNVHEFPGHIACDCASNSEIVVVLHGENCVQLGVLDIDSPLLSRFSAEDEAFLTEAAEIISRAVAQKL
jgi:GAF domain-containing protein